MLKILVVNIFLLKRTLILLKLICISIYIYIYLLQFLVKK